MNTNAETYKHTQNFLLNFWLVPWSYSNLEIHMQWRNEWDTFYRSFIFCVSSSNTASPLQHMHANYKLWLFNNITKINHSYPQTLLHGQAEDLPGCCVPEHVWPLLKTNSKRHTSLKSLCCSASERCLNEDKSFRCTLQRPHQTLRQCYSHSTCTLRNWITNSIRGFFFGKSLAQTQLA